MIKLFSILAFGCLFTGCTINKKEKDNKKEQTLHSALNQLSSPAKDSCAEPYLFIDNSGLVYLSWVEKKGKVNTFKFSALQNDAWSNPVLIASGNNWFVNWADYPMMATDGGNNFIAHYLEKSGTSTYAYDVKLLSSGSKGKSWSLAHSLNDDGKQAEHGFVSMMNYADKFFVSWLDGRNTGVGKSGGEHEEGHGPMSLRAAIVDKQGNKIKDWELDNRVCDCCQTSSTLTSNGPIVVYRDRSEEEIRDMSIVRFVDGKWTAPKTIFPDQWKIAGCPVNGPRADAIGNHLAVAWFSMPENNGQVNIIFSEDGGATFKQPIRIDEGKAIGRVDLVMLDEKTAMASWMEGTVIKAVKISSDGTKEKSIIIAASSESRSSGFPQMARSGSKIFFAWTDDKEKTIKVASLDL